MDREGIRIGTCSWKYDSWRGLVYPETGKINYLQEYAKKYNTVEIDQWFWSLFGETSVRLPEEKTVREYLEVIPEDFEFTIKIPNSITLTHFFNPNKNAPLKTNSHFLSPDIFEKFLEKIQPLKNNLGVLIFQFEYLNKKKMKSQLEFQDLFSAFISACPDDHTYALEIRNPNYLNEKYFEFLLQNNLKTVFMQGYYMPEIVETYNQYQEFVKNLTVIRLMGRDRKEMEAKTRGEWNRIAELKDEELEDISSMIKHLRSEDVKVYININNHYEGSAPRTIEKMLSLLN